MKQVYRNWIRYELYFNTYDEKHNTSTNTNWYDNNENWHNPDKCIEMIESGENLNKIRQIDMKVEKTDNTCMWINNC